MCNPNLNIDASKDPYTKKVEDKTKSFLKTIEELENVIKEYLQRYKKIGEKDKQTSLPDQGKSLSK